MGAHTAKSNLVRPPAAHRCRKRRGGRAGWLGVRFVPSPRPSLRGKGARGHESAAAGNRCGGTGASPFVLPSPTGQTPTAPPIGRARHTRGCRLPPVSTTHAQEAARVVDGRPEDAAADAREETRQQTGDAAADAREEARGRGTRGAGRREGCGVWGGLSGPGPAVRAAREAAGGARPPGGYPGGSSSGPRPLHA